MLKLIFSLLVVVLTAGCATHGQEHLFANDRARDAAERAGTDDPELASVYLLRPAPFGASMSVLPVKPAFFAANGRLVSEVPIGTYVHLRLPKGEHQFSVLGVGLGLNFRAEVVRQDVKLSVEPGGRYFVAPVFSFPVARFKQVSREDGESMLKEAALAKSLHSGATIEEFTARVLAPKDEGLKQAPLQQRIAGALPSGSQVASVVEGVATLALAILVVAATVVGGASGAGGPSLSADSHATSAGIQYQFSGVQQVAVIRNARGESIDVTKTNDLVKLRDRGTGVTYSVDGNRVRGSDGSRYRIFGSQLLSDTGEWFQRVGDTVYTGDGRSCRINGDRIDCR